MTVETPFSTHEQAQSTYYAGSGDGNGGGGGGGGGDGGDGGDDRTGWAKPTEVDTLEGGWLLLSQEQLDGDRTRWFVAGGPEGGYLNESGGTVTPDPNERLGDMPTFGTEEDARAAHASWLEENKPEDENGENRGSWGDWTEVQEVEPWHMFSREHTQDDRVQYLLAGVNKADETVYLHPKGKVKSDQYLYESSEAVNSALDAYAQRQADGDVPDDKRPTGSKPSTGDVEGDTKDDTGGLINAATENPYLIIGLLVAAAVAYRYRGEL